MVIDLELSRTLQKPMAGSLAPGPFEGFERYGFWGFRDSGFGLTAFEFRALGSWVKLRVYGLRGLSNGVLGSLWYKCSEEP